MKKMLLVFGVVCALCATPVFAQEPATEEEEKEPAWTGSLGLAWVSTSGNTDTSSIGMDFGLERKPEPWGLTLVARGNRADDQGVLTAENYLFSARAVRALGKRWEAFGGLAWAKDPFAGFDSQTIASIGATYIAIESERHLLKIDGGLTNTWEDQISPVAPAPTVFTDSISFAGVLLGLSWDWQLGKNSKLRRFGGLETDFSDRHRGGGQRLVGAPVWIRHPSPQPAGRQRGQNGHHLDSVGCLQLLTVARRKSGLSDI